MFLITSKVVRDFYYLYEIKEDKLVRLGKSASPVELEERFNIKKRIGACE